MRETSTPIMRVGEFNNSRFIGIAISHHPRAPYEERIKAGDTDHEGIRKKGQRGAHGGIPEGSG